MPCHPWALGRIALPCGRTVLQHYREVLTSRKNYRGHPSPQRRAVPALSSGSQIELAQNVRQPSKRELMVEMFVQLAWFWPQAKTI